MSDIYKHFSLEDKIWNQSFRDATKSGDKKKVYELLKEAKNVYFDEYYIDNSIKELNNSNLSDDKKEKVLNSLKSCKIVNDVKEKNDTISIKTSSTEEPIMISKLSNIIPGINSITPDDVKENVVNRSDYRSEYISQMLSFPNSIVTGFTYGIADRAKSINTWVEFKNNKNQEFVVFPDTNTVYNKEGFYFLKHAEPLKKISSDDLKGKTTVGKSSNSSFQEINQEFEDMDIDIEIDMGDDR